MLGAQPKGSLEELLLTDDISFRRKGRMEDYESPFAKITKLRHQKSLLEQRREFSGCVPLSPILDLDNASTKDENPVLRYKELTTVASFEGKQIPPLAELLKSRVHSSASSGSPLAPDIFVDQYGFIVESSDVIHQAAPVQSKSDHQKWTQMLAQWDTLSQDRKQKVDMHFYKV